MEDKGEVRRLSVPGPLNRRGVTFDSVVVLRYGDERLCHVHIELLAAADLKVGLSLAVQTLWSW
jgi:hypothetical protein